MGRHQPAENDEQKRREMTALFLESSFGFCKGV